MTPTHVAMELAEKAEEITKSGKGYQALMQDVMVMGGRIVMTKSLTIEQAEHIAATMIAAIAMAKEKGR